MQGMNSLSSSLNPNSQMSLQEQLRQNGRPHRHQGIGGAQVHPVQAADFDPHPHDDFLDQMLSSALPPCSWPEIAAEAPPDALHFPYDSAAMLATKLRQSQISGSAAAASALLPFPLSLAAAGDSCDSPTFLDPSSFSSPNPGEESAVQAFFNGLEGSSNQVQRFNHPQSQSFGVAPAPTGPAGVGAPAQPKQRVRARRGQATDPHSIAERLRRERIAERMKSLQELVPNANKTDKASMLDEIIDYVKFLQLQVKVLSMSRLGGATAVAPLVADLSSEGGGDCIQASGSGGMGRSSGGGHTGGTSGGDVDGGLSLTATEQQVAKLMGEDMGAAMQYLQGKGLCLMPISLATAISTATCSRSSPFFTHNGGGDGPSSPSVSVLTVQSAAVAATNGAADTSVSKQ